LRVEKRHKFRIYFEILRLCDECQDKGVPSTTIVARRVNVAYDRFLRSLDKLVELGMVESRERLVLTEKGKQYVEEYQRFEDFLRRMGLVGQ